ncbi:MAG: metal-sensitive transcriptional regulator [Nitrospirota bacterium]|nr:metal-sensitive transcriptional regulator [Nitrospirota bacterium]MDH5585107.1 metal-sensitive transcriptional regulator [Nitrospirota bacterium]MDH5773933.1 metal-sensitive transcriptional regulator [Nitrospirota bacterium]
MKPEIQSDAMKRLAYIEGHLKGVRNMLEEDRYCVDILKQTHAIRKAIEKLEALLLDGHLRTCVIDGIQKGKAEQIIDELRSLYTVGR